jgi:CubicO group peptidase (beta-lactamase class C family)
MGVKRHHARRWSLFVAAVSKEDAMSRPFLLLTVLALVVGACSGADSPDAAAGSTTEPTTSMVATTAEPSTSTPITAPEPTEPAPWPTEGWPVATPEEVGMSSGVLADLVDNAMTQNRIDSITVVRNGYVVLDTYFYPFPEETAHNLRSATKSVTGTLVGIAIDQGLVAGADVPVVELLPDAAPAEVEEPKAAMTVEDLLTMSSGLSCADPARTESDDWAAHALARPMVGEPRSQGWRRRSTPTTCCSGRWASPTTCGPPTRKESATAIPL